MGRWKEVFRSGTKRVLRRRKTPAPRVPTPRVKVVTPMRRVVAYEAFPWAFVFGVLLCIGGIAIGGFGGFVLFFFGVALFFQ